MTWLIRSSFQQKVPVIGRESTRGLSPANAPALAEITAIVPVRDNSKGIARLLSWWRGLSREAQPRELLIVDDGSRTPVVAAMDGVRVLRIAASGPAAARNVGWANATTEWCAFLDSDCVPDAGWPSQFAEEWDGEIALQGGVRALGDDGISGFYEAQRTLEPMLWTDQGRPGYLITANALVHRAALERVGGFDPRFPFAGGEDVELGFRLARAGRLRFCPTSVVAHDFEPTFLGLLRRFFRYGRGNRLLSMTWPEFGNQFRPRPFLPHRRTVGHLLLALLAFGALFGGWMTEGWGPAAWRKR